jgi:hypothetical protein
MPAIDNFCDVLLKSDQQFDMWKLDKIFFYNFSSGRHFVKPSETCVQYAQLGMVLITPVKFR